MELLKALKGLIIIIVSLGLIINSITEIEKFLGDKTMISIYNEPKNSLKLPLITICGNPPLQDSYFTPYMAFSPLNFEPINIENLTEIWQNKVTIKDVSVKSLSYGIGPQFRVEKVNTIQLGSCIIIEHMEDFNCCQVSVIQLEFLDTDEAPKELSIYVHPESDR